MPAVKSAYNSSIYNETGVRYFFIILFFIFWPFGAFLYALYHYDKSESKVVIILFTAILGYSMIPASRGLDLYSVLHMLPDYSRLNFHEFTDRFSRLYSNTESESADLYMDMVAFLVSRFTEKGKWLMLAFGLINGYVYIKVLSLFKPGGAGINIYIYILIISFSMIIGIDQLSGVRYCLAAYVFFYGSISFIIFADKRYLIVAALSTLIHFSFLSVVLLLFLFIKLKNYPKVIYLVLILSFILPHLLQSYIIQFSGFFGGAIEAKTELYNNLVSELNYGSDTAWYVRFRIILMLAFSYLTLLITRIKKKNLNYSGKLNNLFFFSLIILSFVNFTINVPHFGYRFQFVFLMFAFFYLYKVYTENSGSLLISRLVLLSLPFSLLMIAYGLRSTLYLTPLSLYYINLPGIFMHQSTQTAWLEFFR